MCSISTFLILIFTCILINCILVFLLSTKNRSQQIKLFSAIFIFLLIWVLGLILQVTFSKSLNIPPVYFDYIVYIGVCFSPVFFLLLSICFAKSTIDFSKKRYWLLFIIPTISLLVLWTNDFHHAFYKIYSTTPSESVFGWYFYLHSVYSYLLFAISFFTLLKYSIKNSGFFSKQAMLILVGSFFPIFINIAGYFNILSIDIYITPISFTFSILCYIIAILKFDFLKVTPIALQKVVDRISDSYIIINDNNYIVDFNKTFLDTFSLKAKDIRNTNIENLFDSTYSLKNEKDIFINSFKEARSTGKTIKLQKFFEALNKYFDIEINTIFNNDSSLGTLVLFKDITQHIKDVQTIEQNQEILIEKERLATLRTNDWSELLIT